jgi:hypothetical protein
MKPRRSYSELLLCWESDFGKKTGWQIERNGFPFARLTDPQYHEMFWDSYRFELCTVDKETIDLARSDEFWLRAQTEGVRLRSLLTSEVINSAYPAGKPFTDDDRFVVRGLYLPCRKPNLADRLALLVRKLLNRKSSNNPAPPTAGSAPI